MGLTTNWMTLTPFALYCSTVWGSCGPIMSMQSCSKGSDWADPCLFPKIAYWIYKVRLWAISFRAKLSALQTSWQLMILLFIPKADPRSREVYLPKIVFQAGKEANIVFAILHCLTVLVVTCKDKIIVSIDCWFLIVKLISQAWTP